VSGIYCAAWCKALVQLSQLGIEIGIFDVAMAVFDFTLG